MLSPSLRALCASAAVCCFYGGVAGLVVAPNALFIAALVAAAVFVVPAMFGGGKPAAVDLPRIEEQLHRFRGAMLLCFAGAAAVYATVLTGRGRVRWATLQDLSSLGVALWLVAFVLMFFTAYYSTQRRLATR
jgi:Na+-driven multidrug efflux pump